MENLIYCEIDDAEIEDYVREKMSLYNVSKYTDEDFDIYFNNPHVNIAAKNVYGKVVAFCCLLIHEDGYKMCYTYADQDGKRAYAKGIDYVVARYSPLYLGEGAMKFNKIRRMIT